jgi:hypothetical protein
VIFHHFFQFFSEGGFIEQIANAQTATGDFIFVSRADTTTSSTNGFRATCFLTRYIQSDVIVEDQRASFISNQGRIDYLNNDGVISASTGAMMPGFGESVA